MAKAVKAKSVKRRFVVEVVVETENAATKKAVREFIQAQMPWNWRVERPRGKLVLEINDMPRVRKVDLD